LAFGLSIANQSHHSDNVYEIIIETIKDSFNYSRGAEAYMQDICSDVYHDWSTLEDYVSLPLGLGKQFYSIDQLIKAYKKKMTHNHLRQDGAVDTDKGYV